MASVLLFSLLGMLSAANISWFYTWQVVLIGIVTYVPAFILTPRFILSLQDLYAQDVQGRCGSDIDTAFSLTSSGHAPVMSEIVFADGGHDLVEEQGEGREEVQGEGQDVE